MALEAFLNRVIAPGPFIAFAFKGLGWQQMGHRFFPRSELSRAVKWVHNISRHRDVWHAVASFREAASKGIDNFGERLHGRRTQANAAALKCFFYDADIKPGAWANEVELVRWLGTARDGGLPIPNLWVRSGYGIHLYWVLREALPATQWLPAARDFKDLLVRLGAKGDVGVSADSARLLRPPDTFNYKTSEPAPVYDMTPPQVTGEDFDTPEFLTLISGSAPPARSGDRLDGPPRQPLVNTGLLANARAGLEPGRLAAPRQLKTIAGECMQVAKSLVEEGEHDPYPLWHLMVNLAYTCGDREAADAIGRAHEDYDEDDTQEKWDLTESEHRQKDFGAPKCETFNTARPGICQHCAHWNRIISPFSLGAAANGHAPSGELPAGYRQTETTIERYAKEDWQQLLAGVVSDVKLLRYGNAYRLLFDYSLEGAIHHVGINEGDIYISADRMRQALIRQGVSLNRYNTSAVGDFIMAWIEELRRALRFEDVGPSFGWVVDDKGDYLGLSIAGTFYGVDGVVGESMPGDKKIHDSYQPKGTLEKWQESTAFVCEDRPDLQALVAAGFAAPLMEFVGESAIMSVWSMASGARKTSAFRGGTSIWCNPITGMSAIRDTPNSVQMSLAETRVMPVYWDEIHAASREQIAIMVEMFFNLTQGRGRARLDQRMEQREVGFWKTLMTISGNRPIGELIDADRTHTNAGALRVFEFRTEPVGPVVLQASTIVAQLERNYGHAGRVYAAWIAQNIPSIKASIATVHQRLEADLGTIDPNERFHTAVILGIVVGAQIATSLRLIELDVGGIYKFLLAQLEIQRGDRQEYSPIHDEYKYLSRTFEQFIADCTSELLVTQAFVARGRPKIGLREERIRVVKPPGSLCTRAMIHIGLDEHELHFDHLRFQKWCRDNRLSPKIILELMSRQWPVTRVRAILANGTDWSSGGQVYFYRLQLNTPVLHHHLAWGTPTESNVIRLPER